MPSHATALGRLPKVALINVPSMPMSTVREYCAGKPTFYYFAMPTGLIYVSSYAREHGAISDSHLIDYRIGLSKLERVLSIEDFIREGAREVGFTPDIVAFTVNFTPSHEFLMMAATILKTEFWPNAAFVAGGHHVTSCVKQVLDNPCMDYVFRGEGEIGFTEFAKQLAAQPEIKVKGVYSRKDVDSGATCMQACDIVDELDELPHPDWHLLDMETYLTGGGKRGGTKARSYGDPKDAADRRVVTFSFSRGCPFQCTFCASHLVHGRRMRYRDVEKTIEELCMLRDRYGANVFFPDDDLFTASKPRTKALLKLFKEKLPGCELQAPGGLSVNTLDREVLGLFVETGTTVITLAVESGNEHVQREVIKKRCNLEKAQDHVAFLREKGVVVRVYFIIGFPDETLEQMQDTVDFAYNLKADWCAFSVAMPLPGSEMFDEFREMGVVNDNMDEWIDNFDSFRKFNTPLATAEQVRDIAYYANVRVNFLENANLRDGNYKRALALIDDIVIERPWHIVGQYCLKMCYERMGNHAEAERLHQKIIDLALTDHRAENMYRRTHHLLEHMDHSRLSHLQRATPPDYKEAALATVSTM